MATDKNNFNVTKFEVHNKELVKIWTKNQLIEPEEVFIFNETMILVKDKSRLWSYDILHDRKIDHLYDEIEAKKEKGIHIGDTKDIVIPEGGKLKETLFEKNKCNDFLLVRHQYIDVTFWCKSDKSIHAYFAREVLSGKVGLSNIELDIEKNFPWNKVKLTYTEAF